MLLPFELLSMMVQNLTPLYMQYLPWIFNGDYLPISIYLGYSMGMISPDESGDAVLPAQIYVSETQQDQLQIITFKFDKSL